MAVKYLDSTGLGYVWSKFKAWCNATFAAITHSQASNTINALTGYSKPSTGSALAVTDSLNQALGKLEAKVDAYDDSNYVHKTGDESINGNKVFKDHIRFAGYTGPAVKFEAAFCRFEDEIGVNGLRRIFLDVTEYNHGGQYSGNVYGPNISLNSPLNGADRDGTGNIILQARTTDKDTGVITFSSLNLTPEGSITWRGIEIANTHGVDHINATVAVSDTELDMQRPNTIYHVEGLANTTCSSNAPQPTAYQAATSVFLGGSNNSPNDWSRGFWLYGKWNNEPGLWYGIRKRDDSNNLKKISWYSIAFKDENNISNNIVIYISKDGSDANDGGFSTPVLTWGRAQFIARRMQIEGVILFCFGPGEWGSIYVNGNSFQSSGVKITNYTNSDKNTIDEFEALTDSSYRGNQPPHFTEIAVDNARLLFGNISVDAFSITNCINVESRVIKFSTVAISSSVVALNQFLIEKTDTNNNVIILHGSRLSISGTPPKIKFIDSPTYDAFIYSSGMSSVYIDPLLTYTGTLNALRYVFVGYTMLVNGSLNVTDWPGTANGSGLGMFSRRTYLNVGGANVTLYHPNVIKGTMPSVEESFNINFKGKNELDESNLLGSLGLINCVMYPDGNVSMTLTAFKNIAGTDYPAQIELRNPINNDPQVIVPCCLVVAGTSAAVEGGEIWLKASPNGPSYNDIVLDHYAGVFRIYGSTSADGTSRVGPGVALQIDPYTQKIFCESGGYELTNGTTNTPDSSDNSTRIANTTWVRAYHSSSSDKRVKQDFADVSDDLLNAWDNISWQQYKLINEVKESGNTAPIRFGIVVQDVQELLKGSSIDPDQYGFMYHLRYQGTDGDEPTEDNPEITKADKWYLNYNEALSIEAAYQRRKNKILERRISELETQVENMLQVLESLKGA